MKSFVKAKVFGVSQIEGKRRDESTYSFARLFMVNPLETEVSQSRSVVSAGYSAEAINCNDKIVRHLVDYDKNGGKFPADFQIELEFSMNNGQQRFNATDIKAV